PAPPATPRRGERLSPERLLAFAVQGEAVASGSTHADNVAPSLLGGLVLVLGGGQARAGRVAGAAGRGAARGAGAGARGRALRARPPARARRHPRGAAHLVAHGRPTRLRR